MPGWLVFLAGLVFIVIGLGIALKSISGSVSAFKSSGFEMNVFVILVSVGITLLILGIILMFVGPLSLGIILL